MCESTDYISRFAQFAMCEFTDKRGDYKDDRKLSLTFLRNVNFIYLLTSNLLITYIDADAWETSK